MVCALETTSGGEKASLLTPWWWLSMPNQSTGALSVFWIVTVLSVSVAVLPVRVWLYVLVDVVYE